MISSDTAVAIGGLEELEAGTPSNAPSERGDTTAVNHGLTNLRRYPAKRLLNGTKGILKIVDDE